MAIYNIEDIECEAKARYYKKLKDVDCCPYQIPSNAWRNYPTNWKDLQIPDILVCLIETPAVIPESLWKTERVLKHTTSLSVVGWEQFIIIKILDQVLWYWKLSQCYLRDLMRTHICHAMGCYKFESGITRDSTLYMYGRIRWIVFTHWDITF